MLRRIKKLKEVIAELKLDALFVSNQYNVTYLTGFNGLASNEREGFLLITGKTAHLLTFPTYFELYCEGTDEFKTLNITLEVRLADHLNKIVNLEKLAKIGFEEESLTVAELSSLKDKVKIKWTPTSNLIENLRLVKDEKEIDFIRNAAKVTDKAFDYIKRKIKSGKTEKEIAQDLEFFIKKAAGDIAFSPIVAFDKGSAIPHYLPEHKTTFNK